MAEELIDSYVDRSGVKGDTDFMLASLREVYGEFKKLEAVKLDLKGATGLTQSIPAINQAKTGMDSLAIATQTVKDRIAQMNGKSKEFTDTLLKQAKAQKESAAAALNEAKAATESAKAKQIQTKNSDQVAKAMAAEKKLVDQASNDYAQLAKAYTDAALKAKNYFLVLGENHPITVQAIKDANDIGDRVKKADAAVGQFQRNVGNYSSAFNGLGMSFAQVGRELPSLAINVQTFALAISNNLPMVADELKKASEEIKRLRLEGKETPSTGGVGSVPRVDAALAAADRRGPECLARRRLLRRRAVLRHVISRAADPARGDKRQNRRILQRPPVRPACHKPLGAGRVPLTAGARDTHAQPFGR